MSFLCLYVCLCERVFVCMCVIVRVLECTCFCVNVCMSLSLFICQMGLDGWQRQCVSTPVTMVMGAECVSGGGTHGYPWAPMMGTNGQWAPMGTTRRHTEGCRAALTVLLRAKHTPRQVIAYLYIRAGV